MSAATDMTPHLPLAETPRFLNGARWVLRGSQRIGGVAVLLATAGLWLAPGAMWDTDTALIKLGISAGLAIVGLTLMHAGHSQPLVEVEIDTVRREVRLVRGQGRMRSMVSRTRFSDLGPAEIGQSMIRLWASDGALLAEVPMSDPASHYSLVSALRDAGKL